MFSKYILVGLLNTAVTAVIIFGLMHLSYGIYIANFIGYAVGILLSFILNTVFTFSTELSVLRFVKFITNCGICYLINLLVVTSILYLFPSWDYFAQLCGMGAYTVSGFILNKLWVMK